MRYAWSRMLLVSLALLAGAGLGCGKNLRVEQADQGEQVDVDTLLNEHLQRQPMVTVGEAYRVMLILADGDDQYTSFDQRRTALEERGAIRSEWGLEREEPIDKGSVAYMVCRIIKAPGGINYNLFGRLGVGDRRYALRELEFLGLMPSAVPYRYITGGELVDLLAKADRYMADKGHYTHEAVDLSQTLQENTDTP